MVCQHDFGQVNPFAFASEFQQWQEPPIEDKALFDSRVAVIEYLRKEGIHALKCTHVMLEQQERVQLVLCVFGGLVVSSLALATFSLSCAAL